MGKTVVVMIVLLLFFLIGSSQSFALDNRLQREVRLRLPSAAVNFDPYKTLDLFSIIVTRQTTCQLVRMRDGRADLDAAEFIRFKDPKTVLVRLKPNLKFVDGTPVTSSDVISSFDYLKGSRNLLRSFFFSVSSIKALNDRDIELKLNRTGVDVARALTPPQYSIFKKEFLEQAVADNKKWSAPVSCGQYVVSEHNEDHIKLKPVADAALPVKILFARSTEAFDISLDPESKFDSDFREVFVYHPRQIMLAYNLTKARWKSKPARCEVFRQVDRNLILNSYDRRAILANDFLPKGVVGYKERILPHAIANEISKSNTSICYSPLPLSIPATQWPIYQKAISANGKREVTVKPIQNTAKFADEFRSSDCDLLGIGLVSPAHEAYDFFAIFVTDGANFTGTTNKTLKRWVEKAESEGSTEKKAELYQRVSKHALDDCMILPLVTQPHRRIIVRTKLDVSSLESRALADFTFSGLGWNE